MRRRSETQQQTGPAPGGEGSPRGGPEPRARREYQPPRLECYGRLADVTRFGGSEIVDSGAGLGQQL